MSETTETGLVKYEITSPSVGEEISNTAPIDLKVAALKITDRAGYETGVDLGKKLKGMLTQVVDMYADPKKKAHAAHKAITQAETKYKTPIEKSLALLNSKLTAWEIAEKERARKEQIEREKIAREEEEARALEEAVAAEDAGDHELAAAIIDSPALSAAVVVTPDIGAEGMSSRGTWGAEFLDLMALVRHVYVHPENVGLLDFNRPACNQIARALKENMRIPGLRAAKSTSRSFKED